MRLKTIPVLLLLFAAFLLPDCLTAQYYFGRNKVQYDNFQWKVLKTEHFDVYFYPQMQQLAEIGASFAEEAYSRLEGLTNHNITHRIPLIFYSNHSHFQQTNTTPGFLPANVGGFFEFIKGRVVIPSAGSIHDFRRVIIHEMTHVFTRSKMNRIYKDHRKTMFSGLPLWFTEGIADYWSEGWSSQADMFIRDAVLSGYIVPVAEMDRIYGTFFMYKEGQAICKYIAENFGEEKLIQLYENAWKEDKFSDVMKLTIGLTYEEFDKQWLYDLKKKMYPILQERDTPGMITKRMTKKGVNTKPAAFSRNGKKWVAFTSNRIGYSNIYAKQLGKKDLEEPEILVSGERTAEFEVFYLLKSKIDVSDKSHLAFVSKSGARDVLYVKDLKSNKVIHSFDFPDLVSLSSPNWSPASDKLVFTGIDFGGQSDLYIVEIQSKRLTRLTNDFYSDRDPSWSPDGNNIAFSSDRTSFGEEGFSNLFAYNLPSANIFYLTSGAHNDYSPEWSPDGQRIAFTSDRDNAFNVWVIENSSMLAQVHEEQLFLATLTEGNVKSELELLENAQSFLHAVPEIADLPTALEGSDQLKQLTFFTTGAQDPEWIDDDTMLFSTFQDFSFQINQMDDVGEKLAVATPNALDTLAVEQDLWVANTLVGEVNATTIKYRKNFELDIAQSAVSHDPIFGASGGAQLAMSDMLGNQKYYFLLYNNAQTRGDFLKSFNVALTKVNLSNRVNYAYGGYHIAGRYYDLVESFFEQTRTGGFISASYPFSVFQRFEGSFSLRKEKRQYDFRGITVDGYVISNSFSYIKDNTLWGYTGPMDGERYNFTVGHTIDIQNNDVSFTTLISDYRKYFRVSPRSSYALRAMVRLNIGKESFRYFMGGSWDLRLYPRWRIWGEKLVLLNQEFRFPFLDRLILGFPFGGMGFGGFQGATFFDLGQAWDSNDQFTNFKSPGGRGQVLGSMGIGLRVRLGGFLVLRYEIGRRFQVPDVASPTLRWEKGLKKSLWFGFDF